MLAQQMRDFEWKPLVFSSNDGYIESIYSIHVL